MAKASKFEMIQVIYGLRARMDAKKEAHALLLSRSGKPGARTNWEHVEKLSEEIHALDMQAIGLADKVRWAANRMPLCSGWTNLWAMVQRESDMC